MGHNNDDPNAETEFGRAWRIAEDHNRRWDNVIKSVQTPIFTDPKPTSSSSTPSPDPYTYYTPSSSYDYSSSSYSGSTDNASIDFAAIGKFFTRLYWGLVAIPFLPIIVPVWVAWKLIKLTGWRPQFDLNWRALIVPGAVTTLIAGSVVAGFLFNNKTPIDGKQPAPGATEVTEAPLPFNSQIVKGKGLFGGEYDMRISYYEVAQNELTMRQRAEPSAKPTGTLKKGTCVISFDEMSGIKQIPGYAMVTKIENKTVVAGYVPLMALTPTKPTSYEQCLMPKLQ